MVGSSLTKATIRPFLRADDERIQLETLFSHTTKDDARFRGFWALLWLVGKPSVTSDRFQTYLRFVKISTYRFHSAKPDLDRRSSIYSSLSGWISRTSRTLQVPAMDRRI